MPCHAFREGAQRCDSRHDQPQGKQMQGAQIPSAA